METKIQTDFGYTGQRDNAGIGMMDYHARWYAPSTGRFTATDTIVPDLYDPQSLNRFTYAANNPVKYTDPTGHYHQNQEGGHDPDDPAYCDLYPDMPSCNPFFQDPSDLRDDDYRDWLEKARDWERKFNGDTELLKALEAELMPFMMKDPAEAESINFFKDTMPYFILVTWLVKSGEDVMKYISLLPGNSNYFNPWKGDITSLKTESEVTMYQVVPSKDSKGGLWLTPNRPFTQNEAINNLSLPPANSAAYIREVRVPTGSQIQIGIAAPVEAWGTSGGWVQVLLLEPIPSSAYGPTQPLSIGLLP